MPVRVALIRAAQTVVKRRGYIRKDGTPVKATTFVIKANKKAAAKAAVRRGR